MKLYEIERSLLDCVDQETGEIMDTALWEQLKEAKADKLENIGCWIKNLSSDADQIKAEEEALAARRRAIEHKRDSLKEFLRNALEGSTLESARVRISYRKSKSIELTDEGACIDALMDKGYTECLNRPTIRKTELKAHLQAGEDIPGCSMRENTNMIIK